MGSEPAIITRTAELVALCETLAKSAFVCVDTEFHREHSFWPRLCLVQLRGGDRRERRNVVVDAMAGDIDLAPFYRLMADPAVVKVFHAADQDIELISVHGGVVTAPIFDTQIAAAFCGHGMQVSYGALVHEITGATINKSAQVTDWMRRPLTQKQIRYAAGDVEHLPELYRKLSRALTQAGRTDWAREEMDAMVARSVQASGAEDFRQAWRRLKLHERDWRVLAVAREIAAWRESEARERDVPRQQVLKDGAIVMVARMQPRRAQDLDRVPGLMPRRGRRERLRAKVLELVARGLDYPPEERPEITATPKLSSNQEAIAVLLKVLLAGMAAEHGIAAGHVATSDHIRRLVMEDAPEIPVLRGWRREIFGNDMLRLKEGRVAVAVRAGGVRAVELP